MNVLINEETSFEAFFIYNRIGVAGLTVTIDVYDPTGTLVVTAGAVTEIGGGWYKYTYTPASAGRWRAIFKTAGTVDQQHIPSLIWCGAANVAYIDAAVSTRLANADYTAPANSDILEAIADRPETVNSWVI